MSQAPLMIGDGAMQYSAASSSKCSRSCCAITCFVLFLLSAFSTFLSFVEVKEKHLESLGLTDSIYSQIFSPIACVLSLLGFCCAFFGGNSNRDEEASSTQHSVRTEEELKSRTISTISDRSETYVFGGSNSNLVDVNLNPADEVVPD